MLCAIRSLAPHAAGLLLLTGGCVSLDEAVATHRAPTTAKLAAIEQVRVLLDAQPRLTTSAVEQVPAFVLPLDSVSAAEEASAAIVYAEDLKAPSQLGPVYARVVGSIVVPECAAFIRHGTYPWDPRRADRWEGSVTGGEIQDRCAQCERLRVLLVLRTTDLARPSAGRVEGGVPGGAPTHADVTEAACRAAGAKCAFDGGWIAAEVHVFTLDPPKHHGGFVVEAESGVQFEVSGSPDVGEMLENDLRSQLTARLRDAISTQLPSGVVL